MKSKWLNVKQDAMVLRRQGYSLGYVEKTLGINRSTLSGWFKGIELTKKQKERLLHNSKKGLALAQKKGGQWHFEQGQKRRGAIRQELADFFSDMKLDKKIGELIMAAFYLAEGTKHEGSFVVANSNPKILNSIVNLLRYSYIVDETKLRACLHLRKDQDEKELKNYWSTLLNIPESQFLKTQFDKRTAKKTYLHYKGVCVLYYYDLALQRRILYLGEKVLDTINNMRG